MLGNNTPVNKHSRRLEQSRRRIGKKALQADRISRALGTVRHQSKPLWRRFNLQPKTLTIGGITIFVIALAGIGTLQLLNSQNSAAQKAAVAEEKRQSIAADACRRQKVEQKADLIGKVTYDELYDGNECDK